jgi:hypothetical protein
MSDDEAAKSEWVRRTLGISLTGGSGAEGDLGATWSKLRATWQDASESADLQIAELQRALRETGDAKLVKVADYGLNAVTGDFKVPLMAAIKDVDTAGATPEALARLGPMVDGFLKHVRTDQRVLACDENPVNVKLTLGDALAAMQQMLASIPA